MSETPLPEVQSQRDDTLTPHEVRAWSDSVGNPTDIDLAPDGTIVLGTTSQEVIFAHLDSPGLESIPRAGATVAVSPDGRYLATSFEEGARLRDYASGKFLQRYEGEQPSFGLGFDRTSTRFVSCEAHRGVVFVHDTATPTRQLCDGAFGIWLDAAWLDDSTFVTCGRKAAIALWNADSRKAVGERKGQRGDLRCVSVSAGGRFVVTAGDESIGLWEGPTMRPVVQVLGLATVFSVAVTADGRFAWCAGEQGLAFVELATGRFGTVALPGGAGLIKTHYVVAIVADGTQAVAAGPDQTLRLWDPPARADTTGGAP